MNTVGDSIVAENANWTFSGKVSKIFDEHVSRSVPLYDEGHDLAEKVSDFFLNNGSLCYDVGCSTGKLLNSLAERNKSKKINFVGIDSEEDMLAEAEKRCKKYKNIKLIHSDIFNVEFDKCDLIISYYTIQFIDPKNRQILFNRVYEALNWGGGFLLFEKVRAPDARFQDMMSAIYTDYKLDQGYTPDEIIAKTRSLKGILEPFSTQGNFDLLKRAGFVDYMTIMKYVCFEGILAIK